MTATRLARILAGIADAGDRAWLLSQLEPRWRRRERRLAERDQLVRAVALQFFGDLASGRAIAAALRSALRGAARRRRAPPAADAQSAALRRVLRLADGRVPSAATLRRALAGLGPASGSKTVVVMSHDPCENLDNPERRRYGSG